MNIIVVCTGNSCRSQIAQAYLQHFAGERAKVYSAGIEAHGVNPNAIATLKEDGIDISKHTSNLVEEYLAIQFDLIITVCDHANENCPYLPGNGKRIHYNFTDPAKAIGTEEEIKEAFRIVREEIKEFSKSTILNYCKTSQQ